MFHVNIVTGEATAVDGARYSECGHIRIADVNVSTQPHQLDGPQQLAYKLENRKLYVWMSEETENMPYPIRQWVQIYPVKLQEIIDSGITPNAQGQIPDHMLAQFYNYGPPNLM